MITKSDFCFTLMTGWLSYTSKKHSKKVRKASSLLYTTML
jgi:hypothetical protein